MTTPPDRDLLIPSAGPSNPSNPRPPLSRALGQSSIEDLAIAQKVSPLMDPQTLSGGFPNDENIDEFLKDIYEARR